MLRCHENAKNFTESNAGYSSRDLIIFSCLLVFDRFNFLLTFQFNVFLLLPLLLFVKSGIISM